MEVNWPAASSQAAASHAQAAPRHGERSETVAETSFCQTALPVVTPRPAAHPVLTSLEREHRDQCLRH